MATPHTTPLPLTYPPHKPHDIAFLHVRISHEGLEVVKQGARIMGLSDSEYVRRIACTFADELIAESEPAR